MKTTKITLGGRELTLPTIPLCILADLQDEGIEIGQATTGTRDGLRVMSRLLGGSLRRLHPEVTDEFVLMNIDATNAAELSEAFAKVNALEQTEAPAGEASAV